MKKFVTVLLGLVVLATVSNAQRAYTYSSDNSRYYQSDYDDDYIDNRNRRNQFTKSERLYRRMTNRDQKYYKKLLRRLRDRQDLAWRDGYVSPRERRRIRDVQIEIDDLLASYLPGNNSRRYRSNSCR